MLRLASRTDKMEMNLQNKHFGKYNKELYLFTRAEEQKSEKERSRSIDSMAASPAVWILSEYLQCPSTVSRLLPSLDVGFSSLKLSKPPVLSSLGLHDGVATDAAS
jgi:hypothetical protein